MRTECGAGRFAATAVVFVSLVSTAEAQDANEHIRDSARLFDRAAVRRVNEVLDRLTRDYGIRALIESIDTLEGRQVDEEAKRRFQAESKTDVYLLISKKEHRVSRVLFASRLEPSMPSRLGEQLRNRLLSEFKEGRYDAGLERLARQLSTAVEDGVPRIDAAAGKVGSKVDTDSSGSGIGLIERHRVRLTLAGAKKIQSAAETKASELRINVNIAVVDDGGHLLSFVRMDEARPASATTAITKAVSAATFRRASGPIGESNAPPDVLLNLGIQNAAAAGGGKITSLPGGLPIVVDNQVIGAIGVGGGSSNQDLQIAQAGITALLDELHASDKTEKKQP